MRYTLGILLFFLLVLPAGALSVDYQISPEILLPGDLADCILEIKTAEEVKINSIWITGYGVSIEPKNFYYVGNVSGVYKLPFSIKAEKPGKFNVEVLISLENATLTQNIMVVVDDNFPSISVNEPLYVGEINYAKFSISSPVKLTDVKIRPLFNSVPREIFIGNLDGKEDFQLKFEPQEKLEFKVSFYNGLNYHEIVRRVDASYLPSKGVFVNVNSSHSSLYVADCIRISAEISNLRGDAIYALKLRALSDLGTFDSELKELSKLDSKSTKVVDFVYTPLSSGEDTIKIVAEFKDEFGKEYIVEKELKIKVLDGYPLLLSLTTTGIGKVSIAGVVSNVGRSAVYNVYVVAACIDKAEEFVGNVDPSDYQTFDLSLRCNKTAKVTVTWTNEIGKNFEITRFLEISGTEKEDVSSSQTSFFVSLGALVLVIAIILAILWKYKRRT